jgi:hypothetical protein
VIPPRERSLDDPVCRRYNWCPTRQELWGAAWMAQVGVQDCPSCDGRVLAYIGRSPYDPDARTQSSPRQISQGAQEGVPPHG